MTLLLDRDSLDARRAIASTDLAPLAASLVADLRKVMERPLYVPEEKALLSRGGGRCPRDGTMLDFDPFSPREHRCACCGNRYSGEQHDRFWIYWYQLWLSERAVHAAAIGALLGMPEASAFALAVLDALSDHYSRYPNIDNTLGPTRPFFSTYIESIWLLQLCIAADLCELQNATPITGRFRDAVVEPSLALIGSFDEALSNRQVWNNAALLAGNCLLGRRDAAASIVWAESGLVAHLSTALLPDGSWYEGENYHFFAHRGLWYCMELASRLDAEIPADLVARYDAGFRAPFLTALPDLTFPSRRDSQYAVSLRQWRFAEMCELGCARAGDDRMLRGMLARLYAPDIPRGVTGRWQSTAEAERNFPATRLDRSDLGWKSLLCAQPTISLAEPAPPRSVLLDAQGIGVIRRDAGRVYVALDYGVSGGGHGHPDRLNLMISDADRRILDDMGTGAYVDPSLHWYRSSLAHNAPFIDGRSQPRVDGTLVAFEDRGAAGWICAAVPLGHDVIATRAVVTMPDYLVDQVGCAGPDVHRLDLPIHADLELRGDAAPGEALLEGSAGLEDGFRYLRDARLMARAAPGETVSLTGPMADLWIGGSEALEVWRAIAPAAPGKGDAPFLIVRATSQSVIRSVWSWKKAVASATLFPAIVVETAGERHEHAGVAHGWQVAIHVHGARSTIDLEGLAPQSEIARGVGLANLDLAPIPHLSLPLRQGETWRETLDESHYDRSEQTWSEAGKPVAEVAFLNEGGKLRITASVHADRSFVPPGSVNPLDNEHADINGAGLQLYLRSANRKAGYVIVPVAETASLWKRAIDGWGDAIAVDGTWKDLPDGYFVDLLIEPPAAEVSIAFVINEKPIGRERRRGQLVIPHSETGWIYLRGDQMPTRHMIDIRLERD